LRHLAILVRLLGVFDLVRPDAHATGGILPLPITVICLLHGGGAFHIIAICIAFGSWPGLVNPLLIHVHDLLGSCAAPRGVGCLLAAGSKILDVSRLVLLSTIPRTAGVVVGDDLVFPRRYVAIR